MPTSTLRAMSTKTMTGELADIAVSFVVGQARTKATDSQRRPYVELIKAWAEHEGQAAAGEAVVSQIVGTQQVDAEHMPREILPRYRKGEVAEALICIVRELNEVIASGAELWTWAHVMRVLIDVGILLPTTSVNRFDVIICSMVPGKGRDTVRKNGNYILVTDRDRTYRDFTSISQVHPQEAANREICEQIALRFEPILGRKVVTAV